MVKYNSCRPELPLRLTAGKGVAMYRSRALRRSIKRTDRCVPGRPYEGQTRACPLCVRGTLEFTERFRVPSKDGYMPATCNRCARIEPVRVSDGSAV